MNPIATIPLEKDDVLSIPFRVVTSADGRRMAVLNTFGMPYAQQLLVIDTATQEVVHRERFDSSGEHLFNLDVDISPSGDTVFLVGGVLKDPSGQDFEPTCTLTRVDVGKGIIGQMPVGEVGFNYVSAAPDGHTALVFYNGANEDADPHFHIHVIDTDRMENITTVDTEAPVNNVLFRPAEGRALLSLGRDVVAFDMASYQVGEKVAPRFNHPYLLAAFAPEEDIIYAAYVASEVVIKTISVSRKSVIDQKSFSWGWTASSNIVPFGGDHLVLPPGSSAGAICLWNRRTGEIDGQVGLPEHLILSEPHPDGHRMYLYDYKEQALQLVDADELYKKGSA